MNSTDATKSIDTIKYQDCITGKIGVPAGRKQKSLFQLMMIATTLPTTITLNWLFHTSEISWEAFSQHLYMYPLVAGIAIAVRFLIANPLVDRLVKAIIPSKIGRIMRAVAITLLNVMVMGTVVAFLRSVIEAGGFAGVAWETYATSLPISFLFSFTIAYFVTGPLNKKVFARMVEPRIKVHHAAHSKTEEVSRIQRTLVTMKKASIITLPDRDTKKNAKAA